MDHRRHPEGAEGAAGQLRAADAGGGGQGGAGDVGVADAGLLEDGASGEHAAAPAAPFLPVPPVLGEGRAAVLPCQLGAQPVLEVEQVALDGGEVGWLGAARHGYDSHPSRSAAATSARSAGGA